MSRRYGVNFGVNFAVIQTPYCCGLLEIGRMAEAGVVNTQDNYHLASFGDNRKDAWANALEKIRHLEAARRPPRPFLINFKRPKENKKNYECQAFLDLVKKQEDFVFINEYTNPNTGNTIFCCMLKNGSKII